MEHTIQMQDSWSRDTFKRLKHNIIPVVANSKAKGLIERRPSCMAFLHGSNFNFDKFSLPEDSDEEEAGEADVSMKSAASLRPDDGYHVEVQSMQTRDLRSVHRMTRIIEEDASVEWAAQMIDSAGGATSTSANQSPSCNADVEVYNVSNDTDIVIPPPDDSEHRIWIPLSPLPAAAQSQPQLSSQTVTGSLSGHINKEAKTKAKRGLQNAAGIVKFWKNLVADKSGHAGSSKVMPQDATEAGGNSSSNTMAATRQPHRLNAANLRDDWQEVDSTEPLLAALRRVDTAESHMLYVSEASSASGRSSDSEGDDAHESSRALIGDGDDVSLLMRDDDVTDSEHASLTWSDDDNIDELVNEGFELLK